MIRYSISDLEKITGIKAHTIRIWEKRYSLIQPQRTESNIRFYSDGELQKLLGVVLLYNHGLKISQIASMGMSEREEMLSELSKKDDALELRKDCVTASVLEFNEEKFITVFDNYEKRYGLCQALKEYIWPFFENTSLLYFSGAFNIAHENFINQIVKRRIQARIDEIPLSDCTREGRVLVFLPRGEDHDVYASALEYACRKTGYITVNLGKNIGLAELEAVSGSMHFDKVVTILDTGYKEMSVVPFVRKIKSMFPNSQLIVSGYQAFQRMRESMHDVVVLRSPVDVIDMIRGADSEDLAMHE